MNSPSFLPHFRLLWSSAAWRVLDCQSARRETHASGAGPQVFCRIDAKLAVSMSRISVRIARLLIFLCSPWCSGRVALGAVKGTGGHSFIALSCALKCFCMLIWGVECFYSRTWDLFLRTLAEPAFGLHEVMFAIQQLRASTELMFKALR